MPKHNTHVPKLDLKPELLDALLNGAKTPGGQGDYKGSGGANETFIPGGLPPGSAGPWEPLP